jgi:rSAM/selenodomain-associated transferase 1
MNQDCALIIMAKQPQVGKTKTRLVPPLTLQEAAALYEALLLDTIDLVTSVKGADLALAISPPESTAFFKSITPPGTLLLPVSGADIGACLAQALADLSGMGYSKVIALNSDGPTLPAGYISSAIQFLDDCDLVLGPGHDGGYYLVGMKHPLPGIFTGIAWSTDQVLSQTQQRSKMLGLKTLLTPTWYDIDTAQDFKQLQADLKRLPPGSLLHTRHFLANYPLSSDPEP